LSIVLFLELDLRDETASSRVREMSFADIVCHQRAALHKTIITTVFTPVSSYSNKQHGIKDYIVIYVAPDKPEVSPRFMTINDRDP